LPQAICDRGGISPEVVGGSLAHIPAVGPPVVVVHNPCGIRDEGMAGRILQVRQGARAAAGSAGRSAS
jgi:hypothetical protein